MTGVCLRMTRIAVIGIVVEDMNSIEKLNLLLHEYGTYIIGRMGIPYRERGVNIISVAIDAPLDVINALTGKIGRLNGISAKAVCSNAQISEAADLRGKKHADRETGQDSGRKKYSASGTGRASDNG